MIIRLPVYPKYQPVVDRHNITSLTKHVYKFNRTIYSESKPINFTLDYCHTNSYSLVKNSMYKRINKLLYVGRRLFTNYYDSKSHNHKTTTLPIALSSPS